MSELGIPIRELVQMICKYLCELLARINCEIEQTEVPGLSFIK